MDFPHIFRIISRRSGRANLFIRIVVVFVIIFALVSVLRITTGLSLNAENPNKYSRVGRNRSSVAGSHLRLALNYTSNYLASQSESDAKEAQKEIEAALESDPRNGYALRLLKYFQKIPEEDLDQEIVKTQEILKQRPDYAAAWLRLALLYQKIDAEKQADEALKKARQLNGD